MRTTAARLLIVASLAGLAAPASAQCFVKLHASDAAGGDRFGRVALDDDLLVVGAPWHDDLGFKAGGAYVFDLTAGIELHHLTVLDGAPDDQFGVSVAVGGGRIVVGAPGHAAAGAVYVFDAPTGQLLFKLLGPGSFGISCAISEAYIVVGAPYKGFEHGAAYVFDAATGQLVTPLVASNGVDWDRFGYSVDLDERHVLVGAPHKPLPNEPNPAGSAYLFDVHTGQELLELVGNDTKEDDAFGASVALRGDRVIVGAPQKNTLGGKDAGSAYVFDVSSGQQLLKLKAPDGAQDDWFGSSVGLGEHFAAVGSMFDDDLGAESGSVYLFDRVSGVALAKMTPSDGKPGDYFAHSLAVSRTHVACGAPGDKTPAGNDAGSVYFTPAGGSSYCGPAQLNSTGQPAVITSVGTGMATCNLLFLTATRMPTDRWGYFLASQTQGFVSFPPGSQGILCLGGNIGRFGDQVQHSGPAGTFTIQVDLTDLPPLHQAAQPGETWNFQAWFRDVNPVPTSNFTDAVSVTYQ